MSLYKVGCSLPVVGHAFEEQDYQVGALIATPGFIGDLIDALNTEIVATDRDIWDDVQPQGASPQMDWYTSAWAPFTGEWKKFRDTHSHWYDNLWGSVVDTVNKFRDRLRDLRASYKAMGGHLITPEPRPPDQGWMDAMRESVVGMGKFVKNVVYVLLAFAGGYLIYKAVLLSKGTRVGGMLSS